MTLPVKLKDAVAELQTAGPEWSGFVNRKTGDLISLSDEDFDLAESDSDILPMPEWQQEMAALAKQVLDNDDYVALPGQFEIHEYSIMERFCLSVEDERVQDVLLRAIKGRGAFRAFKDRIVEEGVRDDWFAFRDAALKEIVAEFLTFEKIPFVDA